MATFKLIIIYRTVKMYAVAATIAASGSEEIKLMIESKNKLISLSTKDTQADWRDNINCRKGQ